MKTVIQLLALLLIVSIVVGKYDIFRIQDPKCIPAFDREPDDTCYNGTTRFIYNSFGKHCDEFEMHTCRELIGPSFATEEECLATCLK